MAKFSAGKVNDVAKRVADKLKRQKEEQTNEVDPFDIEFADEETSDLSQELKDRAFEQALREEYPDWSEEQIQEMLNIKDEEEPLDVPEIETKVENLPEEDVNEKKIDVEYQPEEESELPPDATVVGQYDNIEIPESKPEDTFDESSVIDPIEDGLEETSVSEEEVMNAPDVPQPGEEKGADKEPSKEKPKTGEKPKAEEKGDGSTYERYPTELRVAEDVGQVLGKGVDIANQAVNKPLSGVSASDIADRAKIPHYDYTSLFGRR